MYVENNRGTAEKYVPLFFVVISSKPIKKRPFPYLLISTELSARTLWRRELSRRVT